MRAHRFGNLRADAHHRIESGHRLLEDKSNVPAPHRCKCRFVEGDQIFGARHSRSDSQASPLRRAPRGSNPTSASASIVFPLPDSPTRPSDSPCREPNDTS